MATENGETSRPEGVTAPCAPAEVGLARLTVKMEALEAELAELKAGQLEIRKELKAIRSKTDKWSGVLAIIALAIPTLIGGLIGWFAHK